MDVLSLKEMLAREEQAIGSGVTAAALMEAAGQAMAWRIMTTYSRVQSFLVLAGKGNNGGDGLVIARQLWTRFKPVSLHILLAAPPEEFHGDAAANWAMVQAISIPTSLSVEPDLRLATLVVDALLGTGLRGPAEGRALELIREMNSGFPLATIVSVDVPSGLHAGGESVHAAYTVTLAAPKTELILPPTCERAGAITVASIGIPREFIEDESAHWLNLVEPGMFARFFAPRERGAHKGSFGHVVVIGGAQGKGGAAAMSGSAALRSGAGLVTVATDPRERATVTTLMPELMTCEWSDGVGERDVLALGPGLGSDPEAAALALDLFANASVPAVVDADALNALSTTALNATGRLRVLTPHPGEMSRLCGCGIAAVQSDRVGTARRFAAERACVVVLKGQRTVIALPDGRVFINPTGTPAMATAGSGDILTGLIAGLLAQFPHDAVDAILAAVWLHGRAGELGANQLGEQSLTAMDLLKYLPSAMRELRP